MKYMMKELRAKTGMTQKEFAGRFRIPLSTLQKWEQGEASPPPYVVDLIAAALPGTDGERVFLGTGKRDYYYDPARHTFYDAAGNGIPAHVKVNEVNPTNLLLYLDDLFDAYNDACARFKRDCAYDKKENIVWSRRGGDDE